MFPVVDFSQRPNSEINIISVRRSPCFSPTTFRMLNHQLWHALIKLSSCHFPPVRRGRCFSPTTLSEDKSQAYDKTPRINQQLKSVYAVVGVSHRPPTEVKLSIMEHTKNTITLSFSSAELPRNSADSEDKLKSYKSHRQ